MTLLLSTKDPLSQSFRRKVEGYSVDTQREIGTIVMVVTQKMIRRGYFRLIINPNSKLNKETKGGHCITVSDTYAHLVRGMI